MGRQPDPGRLRAALHRDERAQVVVLASPIPRWARSRSSRCEAIGGTITLTYGFPNAVAAIIGCHGADVLDRLADRAITPPRYGVDIDLLTRGAGFGYLGSTITSLIYASFTFMLFSIEASILSVALQMLFGIPLPIGASV